MAAMSTWSWASMKWLTWKDRTPSHKCRWERSRLDFLHTRNLEREPKLDFVITTSRFLHLVLVWWGKEFCVCSDCKMNGDYGTFRAGIPVRHNQFAVDWFSHRLLNICFCFVGRFGSSAIARWSTTGWTLRERFGRRIGRHWTPRKVSDRVYAR